MVTQGSSMLPLLASICCLWPVLAAFSEPLAGPRIAPTFQTSVSFPGAPMKMKSNATLYYDAPLKTYRISAGSSFPFFGPDFELNQNCYALSDKCYCVANDQCLDAKNFLFAPSMLKKGFEGLFGWTREAVLVGKDQVANRTCDLWKHPVEGSSICVDGDQPLYTSFNVTAMNKSLVVRFNLGPDFKREVDPRDIVLPKVCTDPPLVCGTDEVKKELVYIFHPVGKFNISGQDVADSRGEGVYLCADKLWQVENYKLGSVYEVSMLQRFGQYSNCNGYDPAICAGGDGFHVGREAPVGLAPRGGQCEESDEIRSRIGNWYSLPEGGLCKSPSQQVGRDCSWRIERRVKTIKMACLFDDQHGILKQCATAKPPFEEIKATLLRAYESDDPAAGGCPPVEVPPEPSQHELPASGVGVVVV